MIPIRCQEWKRNDFLDHHLPLKLKGTLIGKGFTAAEDTCLKLYMIAGYNDNFTQQERPTHMMAIPGDLVLFGRDSLVGHPEASRMYAQHSRPTGGLSTGK